MSCHELKVRDPILAQMPTEQNRYDILSAYDDLIENNRRRMALLEETARQLYQEWFVRLRFPGREHTRMADGVPEGWEAEEAQRCSRIVPTTAGQRRSDRRGDWSKVPSHH